jgi:hypothetical protein
MEKKSYSEKLRDPRWQKMRLEVFNRDSFKCKHCFAADKTLHVHHLIYLKGKEPWESDLSHLITLCEECHEYLELKQGQQCDDLLTYFKLNLQDTFIRDCCVELFRDSKKLHDVIYLLWELQNRKKEEDVIELLTVEVRKL